MTARDLSWRPDAERALAKLEVIADAPLSKRTTFGIGGPADLLAIAANDDDVATVLRFVDDRGLPLMVLGGGSNLLVRDGGIRGVVLSLAGDLASLAISEEGKRIDVGAGCTYPRLTRTALELGWPSAVGWMGTPGQVGGALLMNAGSRWGEIKDVVVEVTTASANGIAVVPAAECGFAYRTSVFQRRAQESASFDASITSADPKLSRVVLTRAILRCDNSRTEKADELTAQAKDLLVRRHKTQPKLRSAGSLFKNPPGDFAGRLIEASGLKGFTVGRAQVSTVHANFVVNLGGATANDVVAVADHVIATVRDQHAVTLEWEVRRVGVDVDGANP
ncbi:MAG: UDP-N-acetylmuramate dehydrogenase [Deltaproteobacteria bacterium]|nr:UDP-N-acetylmuramate dehydrogenase [Deltaproteobacteria bacterium]